MSYHSQHGRIFVLAEPSEAPHEPSFDIIALHGLGGSWESTWTSHGCYNWLIDDLAPRFPASRITSIYHPGLLRDLTAEHPDVDGLVIDILDERAHNDRSPSPIVFIGHSFGGTILKQIYVATHPTRSSRPEYQALHYLIRGFVYFGTPHHDLYVPDVEELWRALMYNVTMYSNSSMLRQALAGTSRTNYEFRSLGGEETPSVCFYETEKTSIGLSPGYVVTRDQAIISSVPTEAIPLDANHEGLASFSHGGDHNLIRLIRPIESLIASAEEPVVRQNESTSRGLRILSLDGGGVKSLFTILVLQRLLDEKQKLENNQVNRNRPCDYFDLIGGTSTGGLLAIMLGRLQMDTAACIRTYRSLAKKIFWRSPWVDALQPLPAAASAILGCSWYSGQKLKESICKTVKGNLCQAEREQLVSSGHSSEDLRFISNQPGKGRCFVCAVPSGEHKVERIRSYRSIDACSRDTSTYTIWEAARATSAAPMYFPKVQVCGRYYFDGGLESNNPVIEVIDEARREFPEAKIETVVSIGTGKSTVSDPEGLIEVVKHFIQRATNTEAQHQRVLKEETFRDLLPGYFRFQGETSLGHIDLAGFDKLDEIEKLAENYLALPESRQLLANCAARLARQ